jgi:hypothetical protein
VSSAEKQKSLRLAWGVSSGPKDAPRKLVFSCLQCDEPIARALAVSMLAGGHKLAYVAACIGRSESYVSLLRNGKRPIPKALVGPLCGATGSFLIRQVWEALASCDADDERREIERQAAMLAEAA